MESHNEPGEVAQQYLEAFAAGDADAIADMVTDGFVNEHLSALGTGSVGRDAYRSRLFGFLTEFVDLRYEVVDTIVDGDRVAVRYLMTAIHGGAPIEIPGVMLFAVTDGRIAIRTDVWDSHTFLNQTR